MRFLTKHHKISDDCFIIKLHKFLKIRRKESNSCTHNIKKFRIPTQGIWFTFYVIDTADCLGRRKVHILTPSAQPTAVSSCLLIGFAGETH